MCINQFPATSKNLPQLGIRKKNLFPQTEACKIFWMMLLYLQAKSCVEIEFEFSERGLNTQFGW